MRIAGAKTLLQIKLDEIDSAKEIIEKIIKRVDVNLSADSVQLLSSGRVILSNHTPLLQLNLDPTKVVYTSPVSNVENSFPFFCFCFFPRVSLSFQGRVRLMAYSYSCNSCTL